MITSSIKKLLIETLFVGLQHGMKNEAEDILAVVPLMVDDPDDIILCRAIFLLACRQNDAAKNLCQTLSPPTRQKTVALFKS